jgi:hypothetical protein
MDEFTNTVRTGARELAEQIMPAPATAVRARGEHRRNRRTVGSIVLVTTVTAAVGTTAFAAFGGTNNHAGTTIAPGTTGTSAPTLPSPSITPGTTGSSTPTPSPHSSAPPSSTPSTGASNQSPTHAATGPSGTSSSQSTPTACEASNIAITSSPWTGRTGHTIGIFLFHNTGPTACRISGYPMVSGVNEQGTTTTVAAHTLTGWAGSTLSSVPTVDIPSGGYASAGVEWLNGTSDGSLCALVATFDVAMPSGGTPVRIPAGKPNSTDGPACTKFEIHPITAGFDPSYFYPPYSPPATSGN